MIKKENFNILVVVALIIMIFVINSGYLGNEKTISCYQETANISTVCGGLDTGTYSKFVGLGASCGDTGSFNYFYVNYTKIPDSISAIWRVKHGNIGEYNITIPQSCFDYENLSLRFYFYRRSHNCNPLESFSQPQCFNGNEWENIGKKVEATTISSLNTYGSYPSLFDGNWNTGGTATCSSCTGDRSGFSGLYNPVNGKTLYEEAIIWEIKI